MTADHPLEPLFQVPEAWTKDSAFYATVSRLSDDQLRAIGTFLETSGPLKERSDVVDRLRRLGGRVHSDLAIHEMIQNFEWSKDQVMWGGSPVTGELERLRSQGADLDAPHQVRIVFFGFGDRTEARERLKADGFAYLFSDWNESGWTSIDGDWVMHVSRCQPATEEALREAVAQIRSACVASDISLNVLASPRAT